MRAASLLAALTIACSGEEEKPDCWDPHDVVPTGAVFLGTGLDEFEPMTDELPVVYGSQLGFNVVANVRMQGLLPGNPADFLDPSNPRTRILTYFADGPHEGLPLSAEATCAFRPGYKAIDSETYEMAKGVAVVFDICWRAEHLIGHKLRIELEVLDSANGYSTEERVVTMVEPVEGEWPTGEGLPGCVPPATSGPKSVPPFDFQVRAPLEPSSPR